MTLKHTYAGELQLKRYSDTSSQGQTVTFVVPSREELEPFIGLEGKRFQAVFVLVGDDEMPAEPPAKAEKQGELCKWAALRCKEPAFQKWVAMRLGAGIDGVGEVDAAEFVRYVCGVESRRHLDLDPSAGKAMKERVMRPYSLWLEKQVPA